MLSPSHQKKRKKIKNAAGICWGTHIVTHSTRSPCAAGGSGQKCKSMWRAVGGEVWNEKMFASCLRVKNYVFLLLPQRLPLRGCWDNHVPQAPDGILFEIWKWFRYTLEAEKYVPLSYNVLQEQCNPNVKDNIFIFPLI